MEPITVSHKDSAAFSEISRDKLAAKMVFDGACEHYHNISNSILKSESELWAHIYETHNLDQDTHYVAKYDSIQRRHMVVIDQSK